MSPLQREHHPHPQRRYPRVSIATLVEIHAREGSGPMIGGLIENLSAGGVLAACREPLDRETELDIFFALPTGAFIQTAGRVVYTVPGSRYGIKFTDLDKDSRQQIERFTHNVLGYTRRGSRVPHRTRLIIRSSEHSIDLEQAETVLASRHGGLLVCCGVYKKGREIYLWSPEHNRGARARVIFEQTWVTDNLVELGFEFIEPVDFWSLAFPDEIQ